MEFYMGLDLNSWLTYKGMTLEIIVWSMFLGIIIGAIVTLYNKSILGAFVRKLLETGSTTPENAKTLEETGFANNIFVKFSLQIRSTYRKIIRAAAIDNRIPDLASSGVAQAGVKKRRKRSDSYKLSELKFYIPEEMIMRADSFYSNKGTSILIVIMTAALFLTVAILSILIIPNLVQMLKNFVEYVSPQG
jgi:ABC-type amino acid transport system permease subunit